MGFLREAEVSDVELREAWELIREREKRAKVEKRALDEKARLKDKSERKERRTNAKSGVFVPTGLPTPFRTTATPNLTRWKLEGDRDPAKEREEVCQASDVCFLGDKDKASMVTPPQKSIQLKESTVEKSADREAEQEVGRPGRHPWNSETKPGLDKRDQSQGCSEKASCSSRPS
ncbi:hypothetical protein HPB47_007184 [Ixodes persulcatus]|uniref:Uncharacterized protein n=1 Tax=Ixodes persulcatus TaxID=34615 RepID=A0AC60P969_IXOPE|nr:hypothetical protein HPB47_007184 [Ixodes persulcatus]